MLEVSGDRDVRLTVPLHEDPPDRLAASVGGGEQGMLGDGRLGVCDDVVVLSPEVVAVVLGDLRLPAADITVKLCACSLKMNLLSSSTRLFLFVLLVTATVISSASGSAVVPLGRSSCSASRSDGTKHDFSHSH